MNANELKAAIVRRGLTIAILAKKLEMSKKSLYARLNGNVAFKQNEIVSIKKELSLNDDDVLKIFFANEVS